MLNVRFDSEKALEAILYVASKAPIADVYHVGKILYFADRAHLKEYGRMLFGDTYIAMKDGPVASGAFDIIKTARGTASFLPKGLDAETIRKALTVDGYQMKTLRPADENFFSDSDLECINQALEEYGSKPFGVIRRISHDAIWSSVTENKEIPLEVIAKHLDESGKLVSYLRGEG
ncbi:hypothetical protein Rahaq_0575 [Rahnella aceris]|uniref:Antitoxin SocA-like Panacea domain-containing protein n=2 Tax=Rahnella sp. (strain Y9602) TaxID=2703885 RepID=A0A0H3F5X2_RAHSY|nr:hypothetical protein Rahaq_0575 [Rahnella aceris]